MQGPGTWGIVVLRLSANLWTLEAGITEVPPTLGNHVSSWLKVG